MGFLAALALSIGFGVAIAAVGSAIGLGQSTKASVESTARQPEAAGDIRTTLIIGGALIEALTIYALVIGLVLSGSLPAPGEDETLGDVLTSQSTVEEQQYAEAGDDDADRVSGTESTTECR